MGVGKLGFLLALELNCSVTLSKSLNLSLFFYFRNEAVGPDNLEALSNWNILWVSRSLVPGQIQFRSSYQDNECERSRKRNFVTLPHCGEGGCRWRVQEKNIVMWTFHPEKCLQQNELWKYVFNLRRCWVSGDVGISKAAWVLKWVRNYYLK